MTRRSSARGGPDETRISDTSNCLGRRGRRPRLRGAGRDGTEDAKEGQKCRDRESARVALDRRRRRTRNGRPAPPERRLESATRPSDAGSAPRVGGRSGRPKWGVQQRRTVKGEGRGEGRQTQTWEWSGGRIPEGREGEGVGVPETTDRRRRGRETWGSRTVGGG